MQYFLTNHMLRVNHQIAAPVIHTMHAVIDAARKRLFPELNGSDSDLLLHSGLDLVQHVQRLHNISDAVMTDQLRANNLRDAMAVLTLLIPRISVEKLRTLTSLTEMFDVTMTSIQWQRCIRDHNTGRYDKTRPWKRSYLDSNLALLKQTIATVAHTMHPNWTDIIPVPMARYEEAPIMRRTRASMIGTHTTDTVNRLTLTSGPFDTDAWNRDRRTVAQRYVDGDATTPIDGLSIHNIWNVVACDLFTNVLSQKLFIHEYRIGSTTTADSWQTTALFIWDRLLPFENIYRKRAWVELNYADRSDFTNRFQQMLAVATTTTDIVLTGADGIVVPYTAVLRMLRILVLMPADDPKKEFGDKLWRQRFRTDLLKAISDDRTWGHSIGDVIQRGEVQSVITALKSVPVEAWYHVMSTAITNIKAGWYGHIMFDVGVDGVHRPVHIDFKHRGANVAALSADTDNRVVTATFTTDGTGDRGLARMRETLRTTGFVVVWQHGGRTRYLTVKNIYNWAKSVVHYQRTTKRLTAASNWEQLPSSWGTLQLVDRSLQLQIAGHLFGVYDPEHGDNWFNISSYYSAVYTDYQLVAQSEVDAFHMSIVSIMSIILPHITIQAMIKRGTLTTFSPIPHLTDETAYIGKEEDRFTWFQTKLRTADGPLSPQRQRDHQTAYNFLTGESYSPTYINTLATTRDGSWFAMYAMNWVAQISVFHRFIHCRMGIVTGGTGVGKSTQIPKLLLYALRAVNGRARGQVVCTQPRIDPAVGAATRVSIEMGVPLFDKRTDPITRVDYTVPTANVGVGYKYSGGTAGIGAPLQLVFCTDGLLITEIVESVMMKKPRFDPIESDAANVTSPTSADYPISRERAFVRHSNVADIVIVDEAHEHNIYMDLIVSRIRPHLMLNQEIQFFIFTATLTEFDEQRYRCFFRDINDNLRYPYLRLPPNADRVDVDRLVHVGAPFADTRFEVIEDYDDVIRNQPLTPSVITTVIQTIAHKVMELSHNISGDNNDILVFLPGQGEIMQCVEAINTTSELGSGTIAIPYYGNLTAEIRELVVHIDKQANRDRIRWSRPHTATKLYDGNLRSEPGVSEDFKWRQFVIVATSIAEASITIATLKSVIDSGMVRNPSYNPTTQTRKLELSMISEFNRLQRKGRVGRVRPGYVHYLYNYTQLGTESLVGQYQITNSDLTSSLQTLIKSRVFVCNNAVQHAFRVIRGAIATDDPESQLVLNLVTVLSQYRWLPITETQIYARDPSTNDFRYIPGLAGVPAHTDAYMHSNLIERQFRLQFVHRSYASLILDHDASLYCFHPEEASIVRGLDGYIIRVRRSHNRRMFTRKRTINHAPRIVILSELIHDAISNLIYYGMLTFDVAPEDALSAKMQLVLFNRFTITTTPLGEQVSALQRFLNEELPPEGRIDFSISDILQLIYAQRYNIVKPMLRMMAAMLACQHISGSNPALWAHVDRSINPRTGNMRTIIDTDRLWSTYRTSNSDHIALYRIAQTIEPLFQQLFGDGQSRYHDRDMRISRTVIQNLKTRFRYLHGAIDRLHTVNGKLVPWDARDTMPQIDIDDITKIVRDVSQYGSVDGESVDSVILSRYLNRSRSSALNQAINTVLYTPETTNVIRSFATDNGLNVMTMGYRYMRILIILENSMTVLNELQHRSAHELESLYPNVPAGMLTLHVHNLYAHPSQTTEEALVRCVLCATPQNIADFTKHKLRYAPQVRVQILLDKFSKPVTFTTPVGTAIYSTIMDVSMLQEDVQAPNTEIQTTAFGTYTDVSGDTMVGMITVIPEAWIMDCNPHMPLMSGDSQIGFSPVNIVRRNPGMRSQMLHMLWSETETLRP